MNVTRRRVNVIAAVFIGLLFAGLVMPSVLHVCRSASRMSCGNKLKSLALAEANYESTYGYRPLGTCPNPKLQPDQRFSWCFSLLPYLGRNDIYPSSKMDMTWDDPANPGSQVYCSEFVCPSRPDYKTTRKTSYLGMAGISADAATLPTNDSRSGIYGYDHKVRKEDIKDGYSNTISLLESCTGGQWAQGGTGSVRGLVVSQRPYFGEMQSFGSWHSESFDYSFSTKKIGQAAMADGSIRTFLSTTSPELLEALATINGGERVRE